MKLIYKKAKSKLSTINILVAAGARSEDGEKHPYGIAHMTEHMVFNGTNKYTTEQLSSKIGKLAADINAETGEDYTRYFITLPTEYLEDGLEILSEMLIHPSFPEDEFEKEKKIVHEEALVYLSDYHSMFWNFVDEKILAGRLKLPIIGREDDIKSFSNEHVKDFYKTFYTDENIMIGVSTKEDKKKVSELIEKYFGALSNKFKRDLPTFKKFFKEKEKNHQFDWANIQTNEVSLFYPIKNFKKVLKDKHISDAILTILHDGFDSRLWKALRQEKNMCYGVHAHMHMRMDACTLNIAMQTSFPIQEATEALKEQVKKLKEFGVTQDELDVALNKIKVRFYKLDEVPRTQMQIDMFNIYNKTYSVQQYLKKLSEVTVEDVNDFISEFLTEEPYLFYSEAEKEENES